MKTFIVLSLLLVSAAVAWGQARDTKTPPPPSRPDAASKDLPLGQLRVTGRAHVGDGAPDFTTVSSANREVTLSHLRGDWLVLLFAENREDFGPMRPIHEHMTGVGAKVFGICKEKAYRLRSYAESERLPFELLADDTGEISSLYGYYSLERRATTPGLLVLDRNGVVRLALEGQAPPQQLADLARFTIAGF